MRTAIVFFVAKDRDKLLGVVKALARGIQAQGHTVDIIDGDKDVNSKLTIYEYISIGVEPATFFTGKTPPRVIDYLANSGMITGKRCFAFALKKGLGAGRTLTKLMKAMEKEGMYLKFSEILTSAEDAEAIGKRLHIS